MDSTLIKRLLLARVFSLRRNDFRYESLYKPQSVQDDVIQTENGSQNRRRIVLTANGCSVATCSMCPLPDEAVPNSVEVNAIHWMAQIQGALSPRDEVHTLTLFHNGNWFCDREVPPLRRAVVCEYLRTTKVKELVVESLPQYITKDRLVKAREDLGPNIKLTVAIGLQSSSELVRELCIASTCLEDSFERAINLLYAQGDSAQVFLMFHPPFLTIEESVWDLWTSLDYVDKVSQGKITPTICPMKVVPNTVVGDLASHGLYQPPDLWHLYDILDFWALPVRVAASLLTDCPDKLKGAFAQLNKTGRLPDFGYWSMRPGPLQAVQPQREAVLARIEHYLQTVSVKNA